MRLFSLFLFCLFGIPIFAQNNEVVNDTIIYNSSAVEIEPLFPGGIKEFYRYIGENYNLPNNKEFKGGKVFTSFVIEKDGSISNIKILRDCGFETGIETIRVLKGSPLWIAAEHDGHRVRVQYSLPINLLPPPILVQEKVQEHVYKVIDVDIAPTFSGGISEFFEFMKYNYRLPINKIEGYAIISFIVELDGTLSDFQIVRDIGSQTSYEIIKVLKISPKWIPAILDGNLVRCRYLLSVNVQDGSQVVNNLKEAGMPFNPFGPTKDRNGY